MWTRARRPGRSQPVEIGWCPSRLDNFYGDVKRAYLAVSQGDEDGFSRLVDYEDVPTLSELRDALWDNDDRWEYINRYRRTGGFLMRRPKRLQIPYWPRITRSLAPQLIRWRDRREIKYRNHGPNLRWPNITPIEVSEVPMRLTIYNGLSQGRMFTAPY